MLDRAGGYYVFVAYDLRSEGIAVQDARSVRASSLDIDWYDDTVPLGSEQAELPPREVFVWLYTKVRRAPHMIVFLSKYEADKIRLADK